jgi:hypothetical protein
VLSPNPAANGTAAGTARESQGRDLLFAGFASAPRRDGLGDEGLWGLGGAVSAEDGDDYFDAAGGDASSVSED